jgi:hypothetical protein
VPSLLNVTKHRTQSGVIEVVLRDSFMDMYKFPETPDTSMARSLHSFRSSALWLKLREKLFPWHTNDPDIRSVIAPAMIRFRASRDKKTRAQINREIRVCKSYWKCYPHHYFVQNLYLRDRCLTDEELTGYIPEFFWYKLFLPYHNSSPYSLIGENKIVMDLFFRSLDISHADTRGFILNGSFYTPDMVRVGTGQIPDIGDAGKLFVKPVDGFGGDGIRVFHRNEQGSYLSGGSVSFDKYVRDLEGKSREAIIQAGIVQDKAISLIYPSSVNTFRIITENKGGHARAVCAMLRMGRGSGEIDNVSSGGLCTHVDINSGKTGDFAVSSSGQKYPEHPDTRFVFRNHSIHRWEEIRNFAVRSAEKLPFLSYLGWDIALTPDGPVSIEINRLPAVYPMEMLHTGLRDVFGIHDPDFYWKNQARLQK